MTDSIILLGPIDIDGTAKCTKDSEPYKNFTEPVFTGDAAEGELMETDYQVMTLGITPVECELRSQELNLE